MRVTCCGALTSVLALSVACGDVETGASSWEGALSEPATDATATDSAAPVADDPVVADVVAVDCLEVSASVDAAASLTAGASRASSKQAARCTRPQPVVCTQVCGDYNQDGRLDISDVVGLVQVVYGGALASTCAHQDGDLIKDGALTRADINVLIQMVFMGTISGACHSCAPADLVCGNVNTSDTGGPDIGDVVALLELTRNNRTMDACTFYRADVNGDGQLTSGTGDGSDTDVLVNYLFQGGGRPACAALAPVADTGCVELAGATRQGTSTGRRACL